MHEMNYKPLLVTHVHDPTLVADKFALLSLAYGFVLSTVTGHTKWVSLRQHKCHRSMGPDIVYYQYNYQGEKGEEPLSIVVV